MEKFNEVFPRNACRRWKYRRDQIYRTPVGSTGGAKRKNNKIALRLLHCRLAVVFGWGNKTFIVNKLKTLSLEAAPCSILLLPKLVDTDFKHCVCLSFKPTASEKAQTAKTACMHTPLPRRRRVSIHILINCIKSQSLTLGFYWPWGCHNIALCI